MSLHTYKLGFTNVGRFDFKMLKMNLYYYLRNHFNQCLYEISYVLVLERGTAIGKTNDNFNASVDVIKCNGA